MMRLACCLLALSLSAASPAVAQLASHDGSPIAENPAPPHRQRLILKDGSYQIVMSYKVAGTRVQYVSAERGGQVEEIPLELVDLDATRKYEQRHTIRADNPTPDMPDKPVISPELAKEEADRAALTPEVAPDLRLVAEDSVLALDTWQGAPELVPLQQTEGDLNKETGHSVMRGIINPAATRHQLIEIKGERAAVQMHVKDPDFYLRLDDAMPAGGDVLTVDTKGASSSNGVKEATKQRGQSRYAIVRVDVRQGARVVASFDTSAGGTTRREQDLVTTNMTPMAGGHWARLTPTEPLLFGEYALVEILADNQVNLSVWDFGVHPTAPENRDVLHPQKRRPAELESRPRN